MKRRGSVLMEFVIVAPLMLILISMILQFSQIWIAREITAYAAYCACRSVLSAGDRDDAELGAQRAAELACSWMCLAGMPEAIRNTSLGSSETVTDIPKFSRTTTDFDTTVTIYKNDGAPVAGEIMIPGWGSIPGSDSAGSNDKIKDEKWEHGDYRVKTMIIRARGYSPNETEWDGFKHVSERTGDDDEKVDYALVRVKFKFPLMLPLAGRMISWFVSDSGNAASVDYGSHNMTEGNNPAWQGQQTVMDENGKLVDRSSVNWADGEEFPAIELTEYCMLPMPYSVEKGLLESYAEHLPKAGGGGL